MVESRMDHFLLLQGQSVHVPILRPTRGDPFGSACSAEALQRQQMSSDPEASSKTQQMWYALSGNFKREYYNMMLIHWGYPIFRLTHLAC